MKNIAKYIEIENDIRRDIASGKLPRNEQIMTEEQLCKKYGVSRMTVNKAISTLVSEGYITRIPGKGSFVSGSGTHIVKQIGTSRGFSEDMRSLGLAPSAKLIEYAVRRVSEAPFVGEKLGLSDDDLVHYFVRLRMGDGVPIALSYTYISCKCIPAIDPQRLEGSFYDYVRELGLVIARTQGEFTAQLPTDEQKQLLGIDREALLRYSHTTFLDDGRAMEYIHTHYIGSRYSYYFSSQNEGEIRHG